MSNAISIAFDLNIRDKKASALLDGPLAASLNSIDDIEDIYFYLRCGDFYSFMPETKKKINSLLRDSLNNSNDWFLFRKMSLWLDTETRSKLLDIWLESDLYDTHSMWVGETVPEDHEKILIVLTRFVNFYRNQRTQYNLTSIEYVFSNIGADKLKDACEIIKNGTPAITSLLLTREVDDEYIIAGLKAMSKLSKQKNINVKIDFNMLKHLGPRARLDAMKQLTGIIQKWKARKTELPFKKIPTEEDVKLFLFPCSIKYNPEVTELIEHFHNLTSQRR